MRRLGALMLVAAAACSRGGGAGTTPDAPLTVRLTSPAFAEGQSIPRPYTCDGADRSPPLAWEGLPAATKEVALVVEDPDAPKGTFVHWTAWRLRPADHLEDGQVPEGVRQGRNGFGHRGYGGPCPPKGDKPHRYAFIVFALGRPLELAPGASAAKLKKAAAASVLAEGRLTGRYGR